MRSKIAILLAAALASAGCFDDKGNYDYRELPVITIENIPEVLELLGNSESVNVSPRIMSSTEGEITADNPNFTFHHAIERKTGGYLSGTGERWQTLNPSGSLSIDTLATFPPNTYWGLFTATDNRSGIQYIKTYDIKISSATFEGYMLLCNEGPKNRVRMDMISKITSERLALVYDVLTPLGLPEIHDAVMLGLAPSMYPQGDALYLTSMEGAYKLHSATNWGVDLSSGESWKINHVDFALPPPDGTEICTYFPMYGPSFVGQRAVFAHTTDGDVYALNSGLSGAGFELPINTSVRGGATEFRVAPYVGYSMARPGKGNLALFYDIDNQRFVGWRFGTVEAGRHTITEIPDPETGKLFSYKTGMELIYMESTRFSDGAVYSILQDKAGKRHVYSINTAGTSFVQEGYWPNISATDFDKATQFAFHSQFPYMFYSVGNKVYLHNLGTGVTHPLDNISLGSKEEVTLLKFNLYVQGGLNYLNDQTDEFMARQYELIVGSYDNSAADYNGGKLGFYPVDGINNSVSKRAEYTGFARIKDVVYRERR